MLKINLRIEAVLKFRSVIVLILDSDRQWSFRTPRTIYCRHLQQVFLFGFAIDYSSNGYISANRVDAEFSCWILREAVCRISINTDVAIGARYLMRKLNTQLVHHL